MAKWIGLVITFVLFAFSFLWLQSNNAMPSYLNTADLNPIIYTLWFVSFAFAFIYFGLKR